MLALFHTIVLIGLNTGISTEEIAIGEKDLGISSMRQKPGFP